MHRVSERDGGRKLFVGDRGAAELFQPLLERRDLMFPELEAQRVFPALRQLHHVRGAQLAQQLVHLLLAVAGGLADDQVTEVEVGTGVGEGESIAGFYERAEVARQVLFRRGDRFFAGAAQRDGDAARGVDQLPRRKRAVGADHGTPRLFQLFYSHRAVMDGLAHLV